jgi:hypothetical protein
MRGNVRMRSTSARIVVVRRRLTMRSLVVALVGLCACDVLFFLGMAIACDSMPTTWLAMAAYAMSLGVLSFRLARYFVFVETLLAYRRATTALATPSSELQSALAATSYSTLVAMAILMGAARREFVFVAWACGVVGNVVWALTTDDRPALRAFISQYIIHRQRSGDPSAQRITWSSATIPPAVAVAIEEDAWSEISLGDDDDDDDDEKPPPKETYSEDETIEVAVPATHRRRLVAAEPAL